MINDKPKAIRQTAKTRSDAGKSLVEFKIILPKAQKVALAGTFNGWNPDQTPLLNEGGGVWRIFLPLTKGQYEYRYVVDGQWQVDPAAKKFAANPFGGQNSVVTIADAPRQADQSRAIAA